MKPMELNSDNFQTETANGIAVVDFWAVLCGHCRIMAPVIQELADEFKGVKFGKVDVDREEGLAAVFGISAIPTLVFFKDGREAARLTGVRRKPQLIETREALK